jgi:hypothetical protein
LDILGDKRQSQGSLPVIASGFFKNQTLYVPREGEYKRGGSLRRHGLRPVDVPTSGKLDLCYNGLSQKFCDNK